MKKYFVIALLCAAFVACTKNESTDEKFSFEKGQKVTLSANVSIDEGTKVASYLDGEIIKSVWETGDSIQVNVNGETAVFILTDGAGTSSATFEGTMPASGNTFDVQYPVNAPDLSEQEYKKNSLPHNMMLEKATGCTIGTPFTFQHQNSVLRLNLYGMDMTVGKITVTDKTADPEVSYSLSCGSGVALNPAKSDSMAFFIVVPVGTYKFQTVICNNAATPDTIGIFKTATAQTFNSGRVLNMPAKEVRELPTHLYLMGGPAGWYFTKSYPFSHSAESVYEDPVFSYVVTSEEGDDVWFAFMDDMAVDQGEYSLLFGTTKGNGQSGTDGSYARRQNLTDDGSFLVPGTWGWKNFRITVNVLTETYTVSEVKYFDYIYEVGNIGGWSTRYPLRCLDDAIGSFQGFTYLDGDFVFTKDQTWTVKWADGGEISSAPWKHKILEGSDKNFTSPGTGVYQMDVLFADSTAALTKVEYISLIGDASEWGIDEDFVYDTNDGCWKGQVAFTRTVNFKIRMNHDWDMNWGGAFDNMVSGGANLSLPSGTYDFKFYLICEGKNKLEYSLVP